MVNTPLGSFSDVFSVTLNVRVAVDFLETCEHSESSLSNELAISDCDASIGRAGAKFLQDVVTGSPVTRRRHGTVFLRDSTVSDAAVAMSGRRGQCETGRRTGGPGERAARLGRDGRTMASHRAT